MKDLMKLVAECQDDLNSIGIRCGMVRKWSVNTRAKTRWGLCRQVAGGVFDIEVAQVLLQDDVHDQAAKDTIVHELLHTVSGCGGHTGKWKMLASVVNERIHGYQIKRTESYVDKGIQMCRSQYRYLLKCSQCGAEIARQKKSNFVLHPEKYRCVQCGGCIERMR